MEDVKKAGRLLAVCLFCWSVSTNSDQNDPRLEGLFEQLLQTEKAETGESLTQQIWRVWHEVPDPEAQQLFDKGVVLMNRGDYRSALIIFSRVTKEKPGFAEAWNRRAPLLYLLGEFGLSMQDIKQTLALEPRHFGAISGMGQILMRQNKLQDAKEAFKKALEINPHLHGARLNILQIDKMLSESSV